MKGCEFGGSMILELMPLKKSGKTESNYFFEYVPNEELSLIPNVSIVAPVKVSGSITLTGEHSAYLEGEIVFTATGDCTRCLKPTKKDFIFDYEEEVDNTGETEYAVINDKIDLTKIVDDAISINFPQNFLCSEDCKGICTGCGVNLNDESCKCEK